MSEWRDDLHQQRRKMILAAAATVFAQKGYQRATVKEIAEQAGISAGTIYLYFKDKRELLLRIAEALVRAMTQDLLVQVPRDNDPAFLQHLLRERFITIDQNWALFRVLAAEMWTDAALRSQYLSQVITPTVSAVEDYLRARIAEGQVRPCNPQVVATALVGSVLIFAMLAEVAPENPPAEASRETLVQELADFFLYGVIAAPPRETYGTNL
jgi:TetR/AcrR family fatty acid metabolism transcriptional regulator